MGDTRSFTIATVLDAGVWIFATSMAMFFIFQGKVQRHRQWMTRSFACALIFIEVRVIIGLTGWINMRRPLFGLVWLRRFRWRT